MPQVNQIRSLEGKFVLQLANKPDPGQLLWDQSVIYLTGQCESVLNAPKLWTHVVQSVSRSTFDQLDELLNTKKKPLVWLRFGISDGVTAIFMDWEPQVLVSVSAQTSTTPSVAHGSPVTIVTADLLYEMLDTERIAARKGKISDMVTAIAKDAGFEKLAIEPTKNDIALIQSFESDYTFVTDRLLPLATNSEGESKFGFYSRGEFLHFHTVSFQVGGFFAFDYGSLSNSLDQITLKNSVNVNQYTPASGVRLVAFDPLTGKTTAWQTSALAELAFANSHPDVSGTVYSRAHVGQNQLTALYAESQHRYTDAQFNLHEVSFLIDNYPFIGIGDMVKGTFVNGRGDPWSGFYWVSFVRHVVDNARVTSLYRLSRGEFTAFEDDVTGRLMSENELASSGLINESSGSFQDLTGGGRTVGVNSPGELLTPPPS